MLLDSNSNVLVATFSLWAYGKRYPTNGSVEPLIAFFTPKVKKFVLIDQTIPGSETVIPKIEVYEKGKKMQDFHPAKWINLLSPFLLGANQPGTRITFKIRDFLSVIDWCLRDRNTHYDYFIGLECVNALAGILLRKLGLLKKVIYYVSDYSPRRYPNKLFNSLYLWLDRWVAIHADYIWDVSRAIQPARLKAGLDPKKSAVCIHVPNALFPSQIRQQSLDEIKPFSIVFAGSLGQENGLDIVIEALPAVIRKYPQTKLHIVGGDSTNIERLKTRAQELNLNRYVIFYGVILDPVKMSRIIGSCYLAVAPYRAFPRSPRYFGDAGKIRVYAAAGLPIITTYVPPLGVEVKKKGVVLLVNDSAKEYAKAISKIFSDKKIYLKLRKQAILFAKDNTWENTFIQAFKKMQMHK